MANRIEKVFARLKNARRKALIGYLTAGFPAKSAFGKLVRVLENSGVDLLEVGVPFSDPIADGPTIQHASQVALKNGVTLDWILQSVKSLRRDGVELPIIMMSYCNPIQAMGLARFFSTAQAAGVDGLIIPDMIPEESADYSRLARKYQIDLIYLVAPTTPKPRIREIARKTSGFLYAVSLTGVTGVRTALPGHVNAFLHYVKDVSPKPVAVGFGLSTPTQVHEISRSVDGVIVGSALIRAIEKSSKPPYPGVVRFIRSLKGALNAS